MKVRAFIAAVALALTFTAVGTTTASADPICQARVLAGPPVCC